MPTPPYNKDHHIHCKNCKNIVAKTTRTMQCITCKEPNWGYSASELLQFGIKIPTSTPPPSPPPPSPPPPQKDISQYLIECKDCGKTVARVPSKICPSCKATNFGYNAPLIDATPKPIHQIKCKCCNNVVAKTKNHNCIICTAHNWGYNEKDLAEGNFESAKSSQSNDICWAIEATDISKSFGAGKVALQEMTLKISQGQFVAVMGPSGCGKSTLLKCLNGAGPATQGQVKIFGLDLFQHYDDLKRTLGYVPQDDIVHSELTVEQSLYYAAHLRLPPDKKKDIAAKITEVLKILKIDSDTIRNTRIAKLSGGQRKRVSIAVELLNDPTILFLDEPTSPLDPETISEFLGCIKSLTEETGLTVVMVTHKPDDLKYVDTIIFLGVNGYHTFYGSNDEKAMCEHFGKKNIIEVYALLGDAEKTQEAKRWYMKWYAEIHATSFKTKQQKVKGQVKESFFSQYFWLCMRYFEIKLSDKQNLLLLLAQPIIIALLLCFIFAKIQLSVLFLTSISAIWFGVSNAAKEIVSEIPIYTRERMFNLKISAYILSKISILAIIAFVQVLIFISILFFKYHTKGSEPGISSFINYVLVVFYLSVSATLLGLLLSSMFDNTEKVMTVVPISLMPQIMLAGIISNIDSKPKELLSFGTLGRWGTEILCRVQDKGFDGKRSLFVQAADGLKVSEEGALDLLRIYSNDKLFNTFNSLNKSFFVILAMNLVILLFIVIFLKLKDNFKQPKKKA